MKNEFYFVKKSKNSFQNKLYEIYSYKPEIKKTEKLFSSEKFDEFEDYINKNKIKLQKRFTILRNFSRNERKNIETYLKK